MLFLFYLLINLGAESKLNHTLSGFYFCCFICFFLIWEFNLSLIVCYLNIYFLFYLEIESQLNHLLSGCHWSIFLCPFLLLLLLLLVTTTISFTFFLPFVFMKYKKLVLPFTSSQFVSFGPIRVFFIMY